MRHRFRQLAAFLGVLTLSSVSLVAINTATATADAGNPILGSISASLVTNGDGSVTVSVRGQWNWLSHTTDCNTDRAGAGLGVIWNDPTEPGYTVSKGAVSAQVGIKSLRAGDVVNTVDQMVHPADVGNIAESYPGFTGQVFNDPTPPAPASFATWKGGCGREPLTATASQAGNPAASGVSCADGTTDCANHPWGSWGFSKNGGMGYSHTYASRSDVSSVCVNFYDVHGGGTGTKLQKVNSASNVTVDGNGDNSIQTNAFNPVQGRNCVFFPNLQITKTADNASVTAGNPIGFTIGVHNAGSGVAHSAVINDALPTGTGISWSISPAYAGPGTCAITGSNLHCDLGDFAAGATASVHITSATSFASCADYLNTATTSATDNTQVQASATTTVGCPNLDITKTADAPTVNAGSSIGFTVTAHNGGAFPATGVTISDSLPGGSGVSWSISPAYAGPGTCSITGSAPTQTLSCNVGTLAAGASASVHLTSGTSFASCAEYPNSASASATNNPTVGPATASTTVQCPDITITKTADAAMVSAGTSIGFTIAVSNSSAAGTGTAKSVTLSDPLPTGTGISWSIDPAYSGPGTCSITSNTLNCNFGDLAAGASASVHITSATSKDTACIAYPNTATVHSTNHPDEDASATTTVQCPGMNITKTADAQTVNAGQDIGFTIGVSNGGPGTATGVTLNDPLPAGSGISWSISPAYSGPGTCSITGPVTAQVLGCSFGDLAAGDSASIHITSATSFQSCATYTNTATAATTNDGSPSATAHVTVNCPDLSITKTADDQVVSAGTNIGFTIGVHNAGPGVATAATLSDPLPTGSGISWSISPAYSGPGTCSITANTLNCAFGDLASGASASVHVTSATSSATACVEYPNTATVSATNHPDESASATTSVTCPSLHITKTADDGTVNAGDNIGFTIGVSNSGPGTATGATLSDPLPGGSGISWSISPAYSGPGTCSITGSNPNQTLSCSFGDLGSGDSASVHITSATAFASCATYHNEATAAATNDGTVSASADTTVDCPDISITKTADATPVSTGDPIGFTVTVANADNEGTGIARAVTLADPLPGGTGVSWIISPAYSGPGSCSISGSSPQLLNCAFGDMGPGDSASVHISSTTTTDSAGTYPNTATASATNAPPVQASATIVVLAPDLSITKTADASPVNTGDPIGFTVTVSNSPNEGTGTAHDVMLADPLPGGPGVSWSIDNYTGPGTCQITGSSPQVLNCSFGDIEPDNSISIHIISDTTADSAGTYDNTATATASNAPPVEASATIVVQPPALSITKTADDASVNAGSPIGFTVTVSNSSADGTGIARSVTVNDPLPHGTGVSWSISPAYSGPGTCSITGSAPSQVLTCALGDMAPGDTASVHIVSDTTAASAGKYPNTATATPTNGPPVHATATTSVIAPTPVTLQGSTTTTTTPPTTTTAAPVKPITLPFTGSNSSPLIKWGLLLLATGGALVLRRRRRWARH